MSALFAVVAVGCIECGVDTDFIGVYTTLAAANEAKAAYLSGGDSWERYGGDGYVDVYTTALDRPWTEPDE